MKIAKITTADMILQYKAAAINDINSSNCADKEKKCRTIEQYGKYLHAIESKLNSQNGIGLCDWVKDIVNTKRFYNRKCQDYSDPIVEASRLYKEFSDKTDWTKKTIENYQTAYYQFMLYHLGFYFANVKMITSVSDLELCKMVAATAIFASKEVVDNIKKRKEGGKDNIDTHSEKRVDNRYNSTGTNDYASWDFYTSARNINNHRGDKVTDVNGIECLADDNTFANKYIKTAIQQSYKRSFQNFHDYVACHIWDKPGDCRYYASIPNNVLVPSSLAGLTDFNEEVKIMLRKRAYDLFGFLPEGENIPKSQYCNQVIWRTI